MDLSIVESWVPYSVGHYINYTELHDRAHWRCWGALEWLYSQNIMLMVKLYDSNLNWRDTSLGMPSSLPPETEHALL